MKQELRDLLNSSKDKITKMNNEEKLNREKRINDFFERARNNKILFYDKIIKTFLKLYLDYKTKNSDNPSMLSFTFDDLGKEITGDEKDDLLLLKKEGRTTDPFIFTTYDGWDIPTYSQIITYQKINDKIIPAMFEKFDLSKKSFCIVYKIINLNSRGIHIYTPVSSFEKLINEILNENNNDYNLFRTQTIIESIKEVKKEISEFNQKVKEEEEFKKKVRDRINKNTDLISLELYEKIINAYNPCNNVFAIQESYYNPKNLYDYTKNELKNSINIENFEEFNKYYQIYYALDILLFPRDAKNSEIYIPVWEHRITETLYEIGAHMDNKTTNSEGKTTVDIFVDKEKFLKTMFDEGDTKKL